MNQYTRFFFFFFFFFFEERSISESVNILLYWVHVMRINAPQGGGERGEGGGGGGIRKLLELIGIKRI